MNPDALADVLAGVGRRLPPAYRRAWSAILRDEPGPLPGLEQRLLAARAGAGLGPVAHALVAGWREHAPGLAGAAIAMGLASAAAEREHEHAARDTDVVVSGPVSPAVPVRLTSSVATDVIARAERSLLVVSFAAYGVREVVEGLRRAVDRGVVVDLVLEGSTSAPAAFADLAGRVRVWSWPASRRPGNASLHAKLIAADRDIMLIGSANLTDRALVDNIEIGLVLRDRRVVGRVVDHFASLMLPGRGPLARM